MSLNPLLSFDWISGPTFDRTNVVVMLHGILGQKRNLFGFARSFVSTFPNYSVALVDLRHHGASQGFERPNTLEACALDLQELLQAENLRPRSVIGHSFGAGVALTFARNHGAFLKSVWLLDAIPARSSAQERSPDPQIEQILGALQHCSPSETKTAFTSCLKGNGVSDVIASWLAMNLIKQGEKFEFRPDPKIAREMLDDFRRHYSLSQFENLDSKLRIFLVQAQGNPQWQEFIGKVIKTLSREVNFHLLCLPQSGHWVHIDNPKGLIEMMAQDFA